MVYSAWISSGPEDHLNLNTKRPSANPLVLPQAFQGKQDGRSPSRAMNNKLTRNKTPAQISHQLTALISPKSNMMLTNGFSKVPGLTAAFLSPKYSLKPIASLPQTHKRNKSLNRNPTARETIKRKLSTKVIDHNLKDLISSYAAKSRAGRAPDNMPKTNQDSYLCMKDAAKIKDFWMFGVFDGHGANGHFASDHVKKTLPINLAQMDYEDNANPMLKNITGFLSDSTTLRHGVLKEAFKKTNEHIGNRSFDANFSGTTAVTVYLMGNRLVCANVGDSRAVLGSYKLQPRNNQAISSIPAKAERTWIATALSRDHKPDDGEEKDRILKANGRVEPFREPSGEPIGPSRVWLRSENIPGLAMSRSIGDKVAAKVGVIAEPEINEFLLTEDDKFIVIGSDGLWEFLKNEQVIEAVVPFWQQKDPEGACQKLIQESLYCWQREDDIIDDITAIVVFLSA